jgi:polyisoprenoid-binding protein YceI
MVGGELARRGGVHSNVPRFCGTGIIPTRGCEVQGEQPRSELALSGDSSIHPLHTATSELTGYFEATIGEDGQLDLAAPIAGEIEIPVDSIQSGNTLIDREMRNRLNTRRFPQVVAKLIEIRKKSGPGRYQAIGDLTFHGVTKRLEDDLMIQQIDERTIEIQGEINLDVRDFKVEPPKLLALKVHPDVKAKLRFVVERTNQDERD